MTGDLSGPLLLAIPSLIAFLAAFTWDAWARPALPPRFAGYAVRQGWQIDPIAVLDQDLRHEKITRAVIAVRDRLVRELTAHHGLTARAIARAGLPFAPRREPTVDLACRTVRELETTFQIAARAEDPERTDLWSRWRRPVWRATARRRYEAELASITSFWPALEAAS